MYQFRFRFRFIVTRISIQVQTYNEMLVPGALSALLHTKNNNKNNSKSPKTTQKQQKPYSVTVYSLKTAYSAHDYLRLAFISSLSNLIA